ncbi:MAG TPA: uL15m family ribosomal protein [Candidatus Nanoarchaeia archaeon]|nr:uL15m family ribosomal protein [Candidatus Nanoarchaeia archaeon]
MVHNKRKKNSRHRASFTHGYGSKKKHRGSGHKGGKGRAGSGKKADQKKPSYWGIKNFYGRHGFNTHVAQEKINPINLDDLQLRLASFVSLGTAKKSGEGYEINLTEAGYNKLLASGKVNCKLKVTVDYASESAVTKVKGKGGEVIVLKVKEEKPAKEAKKSEKE